MKAKAVKDHRSKFPNPIRFQKGDRVITGKQDTEFAGWVWVTTRDGNQGWAPMAYLRPVTGSDGAVAHQDYSAQELDIRTGEVLVVYFVLNEWGWVENRQGACGWVPFHSIRLE